MNNSTNPKSTLCPSCDARIFFGKTPRLGQVIICHECQERLEIVRLSPLKVDWSLLDDDESWSDVHHDDYDHGGDGWYER